MLPPYTDTETRRHADALTPTHTRTNIHAHTYLLSIALAEDFKGGKRGIRLPRNGVAVPCRLAGDDALFVKHLATHLARVDASLTLKYNVLI